MIRGVVTVDGTNLFGRRFLRPIAIAGVGLAALAGLSSTANAAPSKAQPLGVAALGFAQSQVDASQNGAAVTVDWTVTDTDPTATLVDGQIQFQQAGATPGTFVGQTYTADYDLNQGAFYGSAAYVSGDAASSNYTYTFDVPKFAGAATAHWLITKLTLKDDQQNSLTLSGNQLHRFASDLTATETVDTVKAAFDSLMYYTTKVGQQPDLYAGVDNTAYYSFGIQDWNSGFWKGRITISGPGGASLSSDFFSMSTLNGQSSSFPCQGSTGTQQVECTIGIAVPKGTVAGVWSVSRIELISNAGVVATYDKLNAIPINISDDTGFSASDFSVSQNPVNSWGGSQNVNFSFTPSGAQQGVSTVYLSTYGDTGSCTQLSTTPTVNADGSMSVPLRFDSFTPSCPIAGVVIVDGAGNVAIYGTDYEAPATGITIERTPDTTPPSVSSVSIAPASIPQSQLPNTEPVVTAQAAIGVAPMDQAYVYVYDSSGNLTPAGGSIGATQASDGSVPMSVYLPSSLAPGTYTVGFQLSDAGRLSTSYGTPRGQPMPGGPLQFTVTAD
jgi:hypothetical protein